MGKVRSFGHSASPREAQEVTRNNGRYTSQQTFPCHPPPTVQQGTDAPRYRYVHCTIYVHTSLLHGTGTALSGNAVSSRRFAITQQLPTRPLSHSSKTSEIGITFKKHYERVIDNKWNVSFIATEDGNAKIFCAAFGNLSSLRVDK